MKTDRMRVVQVPHPNGPFEIVERELPEPGAGAVRIKVQACGVCHSDSLTKEGLFPGLQYPRVPGHEVAGVIDTLGPGVIGWEIGQRVGVGWYGGHCGYCDSCRRGDFFTCQNGQITGITYDGGYADYMIAPARGAGLDPRRACRRRGGAADVRRRHDLQCPAPQRGAAGRSGGRARHRRPRPSRRAVRRQDGLQDGGHRAGQGQGAAGEAARRPALHRQPGAGPGGGAAQVGRRQGHPGHRDQQRGHERRRRAVWAPTAN